MENLIKEVLENPTVNAGKYPGVLFPKGKVVLYAGIAWAFEETHFGEERGKFFSKLERGTVTLSPSELTWYSDITWAEEYSTDCDLGVVVAREFSPEEIVIDLGWLSEEGDFIFPLPQTRSDKHLGEVIISPIEDTEFKVVCTTLGEEVYEGCLSVEELEEYFEEA